MSTIKHQMSTFVAAALLTCGGAAFADEGVESCLEAAQEIKPGRMIKVEFLAMVNGGEPSYEIEIRDAQGHEWELMCEADDGYIYEFEREVDSGSAPEFQRRAKVSEQNAIATVMAAYPGQIVETEYEIEADGRPSYEFDIRTADGKELKVEVDAVSGEIIEVSVEGWQIGDEPAEKR